PRLPLLPAWLAFQLYSYAFDSAREGLLFSVAKEFNELRKQPVLYFSEVQRPDQVAQLGHLQPCITAGVDASKGFQIHVHIQCQAMERSAIANTQAQRGDLGALDIHAGRIRFGDGVDAISRQHLDDALLDAAHQFTHSHTQAAHIQQQISDQLYRPVISNDRKSTRLNS